MPKFILCFVPNLHSRIKMILYVKMTKYIYVAPVKIFRCCWFIFSSCCLYGQAWFWRVFVQRRTSWCRPNGSTKSDHHSAASSTKYGKSSILILYYLFINIYVNLKRLVVRVFCFWNIKISWFLLLLVEQSNKYISGVM